MNCPVCKKVRTENHRLPWFNPNERFKQFHNIPYEKVCYQCYHDNCLTYSKCPIRVLPLSLKGKKFYPLVHEIKEKNISLVIDCRRENSRTAEWFRVDLLKRVFKSEEIKYMVDYDLANKKFRKTKELYFLDITLNPAWWIEQTKKNTKIGLLCYCTEKAQKENNCHVRWLADKVNYLF